MPRIMLLPYCTCIRNIIPISTLIVLPSINLNTAIKLIKHNNGAQLTLYGSTVNNGISSALTKYSMNVIRFDEKENRLLLVLIFKMYSGMYILSCGWRKLSQCVSNPPSQDSCWITQSIKSFSAHDLIFPVDELDMNYRMIIDKHYANQHAVYI